MLRTLLYLTRQAGRLALTVWGAVTLVFFASRVVPTDPARIVAGAQADEAAIAAVRVEYGLDQPPLEQYVGYVLRLLQGDLGRSIMSGREVATELAYRLAATVELVLSGVLLAVAVALPVALSATRRPGGVVARASGVASVTGAAVPAFLVAVLLLYIFYTRLGVAPPPLGRLPRDISSFEPMTGLLVLDGLLRGRPEVSAAALSYLALPAVSLAVSLLPQLLRVIRGQTEVALALGASRAARRAGVGGIRFWGVYILLPAVVPTVALLAGSFGYLLGGAVVVEVMFSWNGIGSWVVAAVSNGDYNVVQSVVLVVSAAYATAYLLADMVAKVVDPRTRGVTHA